MLPPEYLDANTPPDVVVTDVLRPRIEDPTLGVELGPRDTDVPAPPTDPVHRLVTVGDSLTHGLNSGAVSRPDLSWPAVLQPPALMATAFDLATPFLARLVSRER